MFPVPLIHSGKVTVPAGGERLLFVDPVSVHEQDGRKIAVQLVLKSLGCTRNPNLWLQFYEDQDPYLDRINTNGLPGLDWPLEPLRLVIHSGHELRCVVINDSGSDLDFYFYFYLELLPDDGVEFKQVIWAKNPTLDAYERDHLLGEIRVAPGQVAILYQLGLTKNDYIRVYIKKDDQIIHPTDGIMCGATRGITYPHSVNYIVSAEEGEEKLTVTATSVASAPQEFPYRILGWIMEAGVAREYGALRAE